MRLEWSPLALEDRDEIFDYIAQNSPQAAVAVDDRIRERIASLVKFPKSGRPGRIKGTRELIINRTPYIGGLSHFGQCSTHSPRPAWHAAYGQTK